MATARVLRLELEVGDGSADMIAGRLRDERGDALEFRGWLSFAHALETVIRDAGPESWGDGPHANP